VHAPLTRRSNATSRANLARNLDQRPTRGGSSLPRPARRNDPNPRTRFPCRRFQAVPPTGRAPPPPDHGQTTVREHGQSALPMPVRPESRPVLHLRLRRATGPLRSDHYLGEDTEVRAQNHIYWMKCGFHAKKSTLSPCGIAVPTAVIQARRSPPQPAPPDAAPLGADTCPAERIRCPRKRTSRRSRFWHGPNLVRSAMSTPACRVAEDSLGRSSAS
jgi:hypothetical protein